MRQQSQCHRQCVPHSWNYADTLAVGFVSQDFEKLTYTAGVGSGLFLTNTKRDCSFSNGFELAAYESLHTYMVLTHLGMSHSRKRNFSSVGQILGWYFILLFFLFTCDRCACAWVHVPEESRRGYQISRTGVKGRLSDVGAGN